MSARKKGGSQLNFVWDAEAVKASGDKDHGIKFCVEHDPDADNGTGGQVIAVAFVPKAREIVYTDRKLGMECTHLVVPGMVVEKIQNRPLKSISFDMGAVAKYMNDYRFKDVGPMNLLFQEEVVDGQGKGFPYVIEIADHNAKLHQAQAQRGRRGSILGKIGGDKGGSGVDQEVQMAQRHARRMSIDARKMSVSGAGADDAAAAASAAHSNSMSMSSVAEESVGRGGRRGSIASSHSPEPAVPRPIARAGGRRGSVSASSMDDAARAAAMMTSSSDGSSWRGGSGGGGGGRRASISSGGGSGGGGGGGGGRRGSVSSASSAGGRRSSVHSQGSDDQTAMLEAGGALSGSAYEVSFKSQGEGISGEKLQLQIGRYTIALYEKNGQPHSHYTYKQLAHQNYCKSYNKGFIICLSTGRDLVFKSKPKAAAQITQEVQMGKLTWDQIRREVEQEEESEEEQEPEDAHTDLMQVGARIMISGLTSEAGQPFNGMLGIVYRELDEGTGRLGVQLDSGKKTNIRAVNTFALADGVKVQLVGLTSDTGVKYNGKLAKILSYEPEVGRYSVLLEGGQTTRIKPVNAGQVSSDPAVQARLRQMDGRDSDDDGASSEDDYGEDEEYEDGEEEEEEEEEEEPEPDDDEDLGLKWPAEPVRQWQRLSCSFDEAGSLGIVWAQSEPPGDKFDREMLVVSGLEVGSAAAAKEAEGLQRYAVLRKVNGVKIGKKAVGKVLAIVEAPRPDNEPLQLEFALPIFGNDDDSESDEQEEAAADETKTDSAPRKKTTARRSVEIGSMLSSPNLMRTSIDEKRSLEGLAEVEEGSPLSRRPSVMPSPRPPTPALVNVLTETGIEHLYDALAREGCYTLEDLKILHGMPGALEGIGVRPLQMRRLTMAFSPTEQLQQPTAHVNPPTTATDTAAATATAEETFTPRLDLESRLATASAFKPVKGAAGVRVALGAPPGVAPAVPRRNVYISPFMDEQDQEFEVARVKTMMAEMKVPGGTIRRVMPGKREWNITPL